MTAAITEYNATAFRPFLKEAMGMSITKHQLLDKILHFLSATTRAYRSGITTLIKYLR